jgi:DNA (cytosine-5)-methyltransferase 1
MTKAGIQHHGVIEWNTDACETIRQNRTAGHSLVQHWPEPTEADVRGVDFSPFQGIDILSGGPPCQPFSAGGKHQAFLDTRDMFPQAIRAVRDIRPRAFMFENVRGLTRPSFANYFAYILLQLEYPNLIAKPSEQWSEHLSRLERHKTRGAKPEYRVIFRVLDAADFGVPQRRHRVVFVGIREDLKKEFSFPWPTHTQEALLFDQYVSGDYWERHKVAKKARPNPPPSLQKRILHLRDALRPTMGQPWQTVRDAICDLPDPEKYPNNKIQAHRFQPGARSYPGHTGSPLDEPSKALKAGDHGVPGGENMMRQLDGTVRYFTVRESARIQTFPDDYHFSGSWGEVMRQLGNAVPVDLGRAVASRLVEVLV